MSKIDMFSNTVLQFLEPVREYLLDDNVSEILINGPYEIYIETEGHLKLTDRQFESHENLIAAIRNISQFVGRGLDKKKPFLDARLPDGSRVHTIYPPCARSGPYVSIRRFSKKVLGLNDLVDKGCITEEVANFLKVCVRAKKNILVAGGTGSGKTTLLNLLSAFAHSDERIITVEDSAELNLQQPHVLSLETKSSDKHGEGAVSIRDLIVSSLRLRPDRIIVGEVRHGEALDMIQAMNTGHSGSMTTVHANSCLESLHRLETLSLMNDLDIPLVAVRAQVAGAMEVIVHVTRMDDGVRRVTEVSEVTGLDRDGNFDMNQLFLYRVSGRAQDNKRILGELIPTGNRPSFWRMVKIHSDGLSDEIFKIK